MSALTFYTKQPPLRHQINLFLIEKIGSGNHLREHVWILNNTGWAISVVNTLFYIGCPPFYHSIRNHYKRDLRKIAKIGFHHDLHDLFKFCYIPNMTRHIRHVFYTGNSSVRVSESFLYNPYEQTRNFTVPFCFEIAFMVDFKEKHIKSDPKT